MEEERERLLPCMVPHVGMEFKCSDEAGMFWHRYGGQKGFEVRKRFVCGNEGHRGNDKRDHLTKCPRAETKTNCQVRMSVAMDKKKGNYKVSELVLEHNHPLHLHETLHLMAS
ncbi:hypothetical protein DAI22_09g122100 [Oryza sativa Japonica Group]|nr:hypothetical protein DAI22_09g122100 [Oryza sativa Japonica Group]